MERMRARTLAWAAIAVGLSAALLTPSSGPSGDARPVSQRPIVQTVKVPPDVYLRLKTVGAIERRSAQDIILSALREYLDRLSPQS